MSLAAHVAVTDSSRSAAPGWEIDLDDDPMSSSVNAARLAVTDGCLGSRSFSEIGFDPERGRGVAVAGIYGPEPPGELLTGPAWTPSGWPGDGKGWTLDLRTGTVIHHLRVDGSDVQTRRFAIAGCPGSQAFIAPTHMEHAPNRPGRPEPDAGPTLLRGDDGVLAAIVIARSAVNESSIRVASACTGTSERDVVVAAQREARRLASLGPDRLIEAQERAWDRRWSDRYLAISGDPESELRTRFVLHHLLALGDCREELPLGARGLTGPAYRGHVFWDADVFVLPALATVAPAAARAMLEYRLRRAGAARRSARAEGLVGARFPWESAATGRDVTPSSAITPTGDLVPILTGSQELHISADVCWGLAEYVRWTGDVDVLRRGAADLVVDVARYWASRIARDSLGPGHLSHVIGPDEYHENVTDNAYTNKMAAWNLDEARRMVSEGVVGGVASDETRRWEKIAAELYDGYHAPTGRHEQFRGFDQLDPIVAASITAPPFAADVLLGRGVVQRSQLIKQADVLMLHHMVPERMPAGSLERDLEHYLPRTAHGSSLSPAIHAAVLARSGRPDEALHWYRLALAIDLDDLTGTGSGGLHYANFGGVWQALLRGFLGLGHVDGALVVDPRLPSSWDGVELGIEIAGTGVALYATHDTVEVHAAEPLLVAARDSASPRRVAELRLHRSGAEWREL